MWQPGVVVITTVEYSSTDGDASLWSCIALSKYFSSFTLALHSYLCYIVEPIILLYFICLKAASIASAKSFVSSFYDVYLSISASLEIICRITLTTLIFTFLFLYYLETFIYFRMLIFLYVFITGIIRIMGGISFGVSPVSLKFFSNGSCFTLFIRVYFIHDDG